MPYHARSHAINMKNNIGGMSSLFFNADLVASSCFSKRKVSPLNSSTNNQLEFDLIGQ